MEQLGLAIEQKMRDNNGTNDTFSLVKKYLGEANLNIKPLEASGVNISNIVYNTAIRLTTHVVHNYLMC